MIFLSFSSVFLFYGDVPLVTLYGVYISPLVRIAATSDKVYQLLAHGQWFSPGTPASSTTKTGRHDIADILLKVALNTKNQIKSNQSSVLHIFLIMFLTSMTIIS
jgi:hypothetical protein